ncbi:MAG: hypothetical protein IMF19_15500 [Proteobacteria bacterium]|nr:hypothetical protein [Pseudomonadota bacterium]
MTKPNPIAYQWFQKALELAPEEEIYIPVSSRVEQRTLYKDIRKVIREYSAVDKVQASKIDAVGVFRDRKPWVRLYIKATSPLVGFKKGSDGKMERMVLQDQTERRRQVGLMRVDNIPNKEIIKKMKLSSVEQEQLLGKVEEFDDDKGVKSLSDMYSWLET